MALREYLYKDSDGEFRWHDYPQGQQPKAAGGRYFGANGWSTGLKSDAAGVPPQQAREFNEDAKAAGFTGVSFDLDGTARFTSRKQRASYLRHRGLCDKGAGYGDSAPTNF
jgi:hypothetical protein